MASVDNAVENFNEGLNCSQAILSTYGPELGLDRREALSISAPFGGGMGGSGHTCGAITGALMVLGLHCGRLGKTTGKITRNANAIAREFLARFEIRNSSITCTELLGCDISTEEGLDHAKAGNLFITICPKFVRDAAEILEELMN